VRQPARQCSVTLGFEASGGYTEQREGTHVCAGYAVSRPNNFQTRDVAWARCGGELAVMARQSSWGKFRTVALSVH